MNLPLKICTEKDLTQAKDEAQVVGWLQGAGVVGKVALNVLTPELAAVVGAERFLTEVRTCQYHATLPLVVYPRRERSPHASTRTSRHRVDES
jgi:hypothetical protein